jgi:LPXTG-motif cell wall-anchored protein
VPVHSVVVHVLDRDGHEVLTLGSMSGKVLWPGWTRVDNKMTLTNPAVSTLSVFADITIGSGEAIGASPAAADVVTTSAVHVPFPAANTQCVPGVSVEATTIVPTPPSVQMLTGAQLPETGFPSTAIAMAGVALILGGLLLVARSRAGTTA